jgi:hypothetical protein
MNTQERQVIDDLFDKLREAERQSGSREPEAEAHIRSRINAQPAAAYYMAQTIVMQEQALHHAEARIDELEREMASRPAGGGFLSSLFGGGPPQPQAPRGGPMQGYPPAMGEGPPRAVPPAMGEGAARAASPWGGAATGMAAQPGMAAQAGRGGFLAGAAQTAMGVAGGMMLGNMLGNMFGGGSGNAGESGKAQAQQAAAEDTGDDFGGSGDWSEDV